VDMGAVARNDRRDMGERRMRVRIAKGFADDPAADFVVAAENDAERIVLQQFIRLHGKPDWEVCIKNFGGKLERMGYDSFMFGFRKRPSQPTVDRSFDTD